MEGKRGVSDEKKRKGITDPGTFTAAGACNGSAIVSASDRVTDGCAGDQGKTDAGIYRIRKLFLYGDTGLSHIPEL